MSNGKSITRLTPRMIASRFTDSIWLTLLCAALALDAMLTLFGGVQEFGGQIGGIGAVTLGFNALYALTAGFLLFRLYSMRGSPEKAKCLRARTAALVCFIALLVTVLFLALFYYSNYSVLASMTEAQIEEAGLAMADVESMWALLPYLILSVSASALEAAAAALFWRALNRLASLCAGRNEGGRVFMACAAVSLLAVGTELCLLMINMRMQENLIYAALNLLTSLPGIAVYVSAAVLTKQVYADLQA